MKISYSVQYCGGVKQEGPMTIKQDLNPLIINPTPRDLAQALYRHACVSIILKGEKINDLEIAFIQRALNDSDRWSGQLAFPGGKREEFDLTHLDTAIRETQEEVGIKLSQEELLGRIDDVQARKAGTLLDFYIRPFVFHTSREFSTELDASEVADFFWVPLSYLEDPTRLREHTVQYEDKQIQLPAVDLGRNPPLWGLTYLMTIDLMKRLRARK